MSKTSKTATGPPLRRDLPEPPRVAAVKVVVTGSSGFIGAALVRRLAADGHHVVRLVRHPPASGTGEVSWDPSTGKLDPEHLAGIEAAVNLAGAGIGDHRWTAAYKKQILDSRVDATRTLATVLAKLDPLPKALVSASAFGIYGDRGDEELTEDSARGQGFLADVVVAWEAATEAAATAGIRVTCARSGIVLAPHGGALGRMLPLAKRHLAGRLGSGRQWWPWITLDDEVSALVHLLTTNDLAGPVNLAAPEQVRQADAAKAIGAALGRPRQLPAPAPGVRLALGGVAADILASARVRPERLAKSGFTWSHPELREAVSWMIGRG